MMYMMNGNQESVRWIVLSLGQLIGVSLALELRAKMLQVVAGVERSEIQHSNYQISHEVYYKIKGLSPNLNKME